MDDIINLATLVLLIVEVAIIVPLTWVLLLTERRRRQRFRDDCRLVSDGFRDKTINDNRDVQLIFDLSRRIYGERFTFVLFLKRYLRHLRSHPADVSPEEFNDINQRIKDLIMEEESHVPFDGVPDAEKRVLLSIREESTPSVQQKLPELAEMIRARDGELKSAKRINYWTIPLSIIGIALTIVFGVKSLSPKDKGETHGVETEIVESPLE
ncbi:MAG: hypothetical protein IKX20_08805 [Paludibacteraceae bacterium]|nr:hypothetical protein [Paludibacteraceae bacterium]